MEITFWGATQTVTGSMHLIKLNDGTRILLDCGLFQGDPEKAEELNKEWPCPPSQVDYLILSHAHIDHCGNIPAFVKAGFRGFIFCTHATYDLCTIMLQDSAEIQEKDAEQENKWRDRKGLAPLEPLYTLEDVGPALEQFSTLSYGRWHKIHRGVELLFLDAGHMLGSASVTLRVTEGDRHVVVGFTGDVGRPNRPILKDPVPMPPCDYLISESTYGGREHDELPEAREHLLGIIYRACVERRGKLIIPAFSVGRTQDIVHSLDQLELEGKLPRIPVYVDSPLAIDASRIYEMHPECFDKEMQAYLKEDPNPWGFQKLHYVRSVNESKLLNTSSGPCIIIAASGMMNAGRILHHLKHSIEDPKNTILAVGHCSQNTLGARILRGDESVRIYGKQYQVKAQVERISAYSAHADHSELFDFISQSQKPDTLKGLFLVHGESEQLRAFSDHLKSKGYSGVETPFRGQTYSL